MFGWGKKKDAKSDKKQQPKVELVKVEVPFENPPATSKPPAEKSLTKEQRAKYTEVLKHFQDESLELPITEKHAAGDEKRALSHDEKAWLTRECLLRYLRATKWVVHDAISRIEGSISWRREFGIDNYLDESKNIVTPALVEEESRTGKEVVLGFDNDARPCLYLKPGRQNTKSSFRQVQFLVWTLERTIDFMRPGQDSLTLLIDFLQHPELKSQVEVSKVPPLNVGRQVLHILQTHYPERLGKALLTNIPFLGWGFLKLIHPFIDPLTREKIIYDEPFIKYCPSEQLDKDFEGSVDFEYNHDVYYNTLVEMAEKKRKHYINRFDKFGALIGLSEVDLRGEGDEITIPIGTHAGDDKLVSEKTTTTTTEEPSEEKENSSQDAEVVIEETVEDKQVEKLAEQTAEKLTV